MAPEHESDGRWLRRLYDQAQDWLARTGGLVVWDKRNDEIRQTTTPNYTQAYADITFAFGLCRLGDDAGGRELTGRGGAALGGLGEPHATLLAAYRFRIGQAAEGGPASGPLPDALLTHLSEMGEDISGRIARYAVDRLRQHSRILEPDYKVDPYRCWQAHLGGIHHTLVELDDIINPEELIGRIKDLLLAAHGRKPAVGRRWNLLLKALTLAPKVGGQFTREMLREAALETGREDLLDRWAEERLSLLGEAVSAAARFAYVDELVEFVGRVRALLRADRTSVLARFLPGLADRCLPGMRAGPRQELEGLVDDVVASTSQLDSDPSVSPWAGSEGWHVKLELARQMYFLGRTREAELIVRGAPETLLNEEMQGWARARLASRYIAAVSQLTGPAAGGTSRERLEELFARLEGVHDTFSTSKHYSLSHLFVIEAAVLGVAESRGADSVPTPIIR
jgi:hypothetical protein